MFDHAQAIAELLYKQAESLITEYGISGASLAVIDEKAEMPLAVRLYLKDASQDQTSLPKSISVDLDGVGTISIPTLVTYTGSFEGQIYSQSP